MNGWFGRLEIIKEEAETIKSVTMQTILLT